MNYLYERPWFLAISPAYLAFLPFFVIWAIVPPGGIGAKFVSTIRYILILSIVSLFINFYLAPAYPRYLFPTWICFSLLSAWVLAITQDRWPRLGKILVPIALILPFLIVFGMAARRVREVIPEYFSKQARIEAIARSYPGYETFLWANDHLDPSHDIILTTDPKTYYLDAPAIIAKPGIESPMLLPWDSEPLEILAAWRKLGATHFMLDTTLTSVKHGFGIAFFTDVLAGRDKVWLDIVTTREGADVYGIGDILTDPSFST